MKILQKDYNVATRTNDLHNQQINENINSEEGTEDWLKMLINELAKISGDVSLTPIKIITGWGTQKMRKYGMQLKNKFWKSIFTGIEQLEEGFYHKNNIYMGEMVIYDTQKKEQEEYKGSKYNRKWHIKRHTWNNNYKPPNKTSAKIYN